MKCSPPGWPARSSPSGLAEYARRHQTARADDAPRPRPASAPRPQPCWPPGRGRRPGAPAAPSTPGPSCCSRAGGPAAGGFAAVARPCFTARLLRGGFRGRPLRRRRPPGLGAGARPPPARAPGGGAAGGPRHRPLHRRHRLFAEGGHGVVHRRPGRRAGWQCGCLARAVVTSPVAVGDTGSTSPCARGPGRGLGGADRRGGPGGAGRHGGAGGLGQVSPRAVTADNGRCSGVAGPARRVWRAPGMATSRRGWRGTPRPLALTATASSAAPTGALWRVPRGGTPAVVAPAGVLDFQVMSGPGALHHPARASSG